MSKEFMNIVSKSESEAEISIYGEIVETCYDSWTGEDYPGYASQEKFIQEIKALKDKKSITIRINSVGGSTFVGLAMYSQLRALPAKKTVIVDGIAASAATIVMLAGDIIKIPMGSLVMIHEARNGMFGYYSAAELEVVKNAVTTINSSVADHYAERTGLSKEELLTMMADETWMTGTEAVEKGFATELMQDTAPVMIMRLDKDTVSVNGAKFNADYFKSCNINIIKEVPSMSEKPKKGSTSEDEKPIEETDDEEVVETDGKESDAKSKAVAKPVHPAVQRVNEIVDLCSIAGVSASQTNKFIKAEMSVADVRKSLLKLKEEAFNDAATSSAHAGVGSVQKSGVDIAKEKYGKK